MSGQISMGLFDPVADTADDCTVVPLQCPIEVFTNQAGGVTIRQDQTGWMGETVVIAMVDKNAVRAVIAALRHEIGDQ